MIRKRQSCFNQPVSSALSSPKPIAVICVAVVLGATAPPALSQPPDNLQKWIDESVVHVASIDPMNEDFSDLEPLAQAIGSTRVVQLGEPSHGAGNSFSAKVRLIKFLHQRLGFDVLIWESGMHGLRLAQAGMRSGEDAVSSAQRGIFPIWSNAEEVKPLFEYVKASQSTTLPIEMAGFDIQFTADKAFEHFAEDLRSFVTAVRDPAIRGRSQNLAGSAIKNYEHICCALSEARARRYGELQASGYKGENLESAIKQWEQKEGANLWPKERDVEELRKATDGLLETIEANHALFAQVHGDSEISFMEHAIRNLRADGAGKLDINFGVSGATNASFQNMLSYFNRRDEVNAWNVRWLVEQEYTGSKVIIWAHNAHIINAHFGPKFSDVRLDSQPGDMTPTGVYLAEWFGDNVYTIGLTTYQGNDGWVTSNIVTALPAVSENSLESRLHVIGRPYLFLDFRGLDGNTEHPLRKPQFMRILVPVPGSATAAPAYGNYNVDDITQAFDAVFYIDRTTPATRIVGH